jgi:hypothetical protein
MMNDFFQTFFCASKVEQDSSVQVPGPHAESPGLGELFSDLLASFQAKGEGKSMDAVFNQKPVDGKECPDEKGALFFGGEGLSIDDCGGEPASWLEYIHNLAVRGGVDGSAEKGGTELSAANQSIEGMDRPFLSEAGIFSRKESQGISGQRGDEWLLAPEIGRRVVQRSGHIPPGVTDVAADQAKPVIEGVNPEIKGGGFREAIGFTQTGPLEAGEIVSKKGLEAGIQPELLQPRPTGASIPVAGLERVSAEKAVPEGATPLREVTTESVRLFKASLSAAIPDHAPNSLNAPNPPNVPNALNIAAGAAPVPSAETVHVMADSLGSSPGEKRPEVIVMPNSEKGVDSPQKAIAPQFGEPLRAFDFSPLVGGGAGMQAKPLVGLVNDKRSMASASDLLSTVGAAERPVEGNRPGADPVVVAASRSAADAESKSIQLEELATRFDRRLAAMVEKDQKVMKLTVEPPSLGKLTVTCRETPGGMQVEIQTQSLAVRQMLAQQEPNIRALFQEQGTVLQQFDVFCDSQQHRQPSDGREVDEEGWLADGTSPALDEVEEEVEAPVHLRAAGSSTISLVA